MEPPTFEPASQPLRAYAGATFATGIKLWNPTTPKTPFDLTGYTVELVIIGVQTLIAGEGLTINDEEGEITAELSPAEVSAIVGNRSNLVARYFLSIAKAGTVTYLMRGSFDFKQP